MRELNPATGLFGPHDVARLRDAYEAALTIASDEAGPFRLVPGHELRRRLSRAVVGEARRGVESVDQLRALALRALCASIGRDEDDASGAAARAGGARLLPLPR